MKKNKNKGFTLIELIAVLVIMAVIALIVTPLVLNIVRKAKDSANKRSVDAYGKSIDLAVASYLIEKGDFPTSVDQLTIEYSGKEVICGITKLNEDSSVYLSKCSVGGVEVKDSSNKDGYYHYGTTATYKEYKIGDIITYNGMNFYVIENSDDMSDSITMLKAEPLTVDEVNTYGVGHVNMYSTYNTSASYYQTAYNQNGYGGMAYYTSTTCGYPTAGNSTLVTTGCTTDYAQSEVKYAVDAWAKDKLKTSDLKEDETGYSARLITIDELTNNMGYEIINNGSAIYGQKVDSTPDWIYNSNYWYWTMSPFQDEALRVWYVYGIGNVYTGYVCNGNDGVVRPVVTLLKSAL